MTVTDDIRDFSCPVCGATATANVRTITTSSGTVHAVSRIECEGEGCDIGKAAAELALGVCPTCSQAMRRRPSREQSLIGGDYDWYCNRCRAVKGDATQR